MDPKQSDALDRVMDLVRFLRTHCPWDAAQTPRSLVPYLLEEAHEAADAIADGDDPHLKAELGDLLLNVAFQIVLAQEREAFDADDVATTVIDKMRRRHPHLFGLGEKEDWETLKARERAEAARAAHAATETTGTTAEDAEDAEDARPVDPGSGGILHGVARGLDPLSRAHRIQDRVSRVGFDWADYRGALDKVVEELEEVREELDKPQLHNGTTPQQHNSTTAQQQNGPTAEQPQPAEVGGSALEEEMGDLLFAVVNLARLSGVHSLTALQRANAKFTRRFQALEALAADRGLALEEIGLEALDVLWDEVKAGERSAFSDQLSDRDEP